MSIPGLLLGLALFFLKQYHIGHPLINIPVGLLVPFALFYIILFAGEHVLFLVFVFASRVHGVVSAFPYILVIIIAGGWSMQDAIDAGWLYAPFEQVPFYSIWTGFSFKDVAFSKVFARWTDMIVLLIIMSLDAVLKLVGIRQLDIDLDYDKEMKLNGLYNFVCAAMFAAPGYIMLKFTAVNEGIIRNTTDRLPGVIYSAFVALIFFSGFPLINYLPRFFLCALVVYAGFGFIWDHLVLTWAKLPRLEYCTIWFIVLMTALTQILWAVMVGVVLAIFIFMYKYGRRGTIKAVVDGSKYQSRVYRSYREQIKVRHLGQFFTIVELHRYLFFASVVSVQELVRKLLEERASKKAALRQKYLLIDCSAVDGIDVTGTMVFLEIAKACAKDGLPLIMAGLSAKDQAKFESIPEFSQYVKIFRDRDSGTEWVEEELLAHSARVRRRWFVFEPLLVLHGHHLLKAKYEALEDLLGENIGQNVWQYTETETVEAGAYLCRAGEVNDKLYVLQRGRLTSYMETENGQRIRVHTMTRGTCVNEDALFLDLPTTQSIIADEKSVVISITRENWRQLEADDPMIALQVQRTVLLHASTVRKTLEQQLDVLERWDKEIKPEPLMLEQTNPTYHKFGRVVMAQKEMMANSTPTPKQSQGTAQRMFRSPSLSLFHESSHHFHHLQHAHSIQNLGTLVDEDDLPNNQRKLADISPTQRGSDYEIMVASTDIHLSNQMVQLATSCFDVFMARQGAEDPEFTQNNPNHLEYKRVRQALFHLGKFPTDKELGNIVKALIKKGKYTMTWLDFFEKGVTRSLFMDIITKLDLADLSDDDKKLFHRVFKKYAKFDPKIHPQQPMLSAQGLGELMREMGHPEEPLELVRLVNEWTEEGNRHIGLATLLSMMAHFLKIEELDERVEELFLKFARKEKMHNISRANLWDDCIERDDILRVFAEYNYPITPEEADELIVDADFAMSGSIDFYEFRAAITLVSEEDLAGGDLELELNAQRMSHWVAFTPSAQSRRLPRLSSSPNQPQGRQLDWSRRASQENDAEDGLLSSSHMLRVNVELVDQSISKVSSN